jgi:hypothetical protein
MLVQKPKNLQSVFILLRLVIKIVFNFLLMFLVQKSSMFFSLTMTGWCSDRRNVKVIFLLLWLDSPIYGPGPPCFVEVS